MASERKAKDNTETLVKRVIAPISFTVEITATKVNENGTLSGITTKVIKQTLPKDNLCYISYHQMGGGQMWAKVTNDTGLEYLATEDAEKAKKAKAKLF